MHQSQDIENKPQNFWALLKLSRLKKTTDFEESLSHFPWQFHQKWEGKKILTRSLLHRQGTTAPSMPQGSPRSSSPREDVTWQGPAGSPEPPAPRKPWFIGPQRRSVQEVDTSQIRLHFMFPWRKNKKHKIWTFFRRIIYGAKFRP